MKPHLPVALLSLLSVASLAQAVEIPDDYELITLRSASDLDGHVSSDSAGSYAFLLKYDIACTPTTNSSWTSITPLITGSNLIFTTAAGANPKALSFSNGTSAVFYSPSTLTFDNLSNLTFTGQNGASAIYLSSKEALYISNVSDGVEGTSDVVFSNNKCADFKCAIDTSGSVVIGNNGDVSIDGNSSSYGFGGAISAYGTFNIINNGNVSISGNSVLDGSGGAIDSNISTIIPYFNISGNGEVSINGNSATSRGGAIFSGTRLYINNNNGNVSINSNSVTSSSSSEDSAYGGALYFSKSQNIGTASKKSRE